MKSTRATAEARSNEAAPQSDAAGDARLINEQPLSAAESANRSLARAEQDASIATLPAGPRERRVALAVVILSTIGFIAAIPFVRVSLPQIPAFIPAYESALAINDLITAVLLFGQFGRLRAPALLALAAGYLFDAFVMIPHVLSFPGVFSATGLLGAGPQTTAWLYVFWHGGFALFALAYALLSKRSPLDTTMRITAGRAIALSVVGVLVLVPAITLLSTVGHDLLPVIINGTDFSFLVSKGVSPTIWVLSLLALLALLRRPKPSVLDLWVMVVLSTWLFDVGLSAIIDSHRYDLGFYVGRLYGLLASCFVLVVLLLETNELHAKLATANGSLAKHGRALEERVRERTAELARSNDALKTEMAERKDAEARLVHAQKMEAIGKLTGGMAHDFNNLLGIIVGNLDLMRGSAPADSTTDELMGEALGAALRGSELTRRLLAFARRQDLQPTRLNVNELVDGIAKLLGRMLGEGIDIHLDLAPDLWPVTADPAQLEAALVNLANNARDAMPKGGLLRITTNNQTLDEDYASQHVEVAAGDYAMIEVSDTGMGMKPDIVARIFEPFFTTKEQDKGTGLGLSMVFGFVKQSAGHINVYSEVGIGTTFRIYLPRNKTVATAVNASAVEDVPLGNGETILVVEDHPGLRRLVMRQVLELGYHAIEADGASAAVIALERQPADLLFTDIVMPGRLNGLDLARVALRRWPKMRVILTSGFPAKIGGSIDGSARLLMKPYRKADLARALRDVLQGEQKAAG